MTIARLLCLACFLWVSFPCLAQEVDKEKLQRLSKTYGSQLASWQLYLQDELGPAQHLQLFQSDRPGLEQDIYGGFSQAPAAYQGIWSLFLGGRKKPNRFKRERGKKPPSTEPTITSSEVKPYRLRVFLDSRPTDRDLPDGFRLVPADQFVAYLSSPQSVDTLEQCMTEYGALLTEEFGVNLSFQEALAAQIGLENFSQLADLTSEVYFISEEISVKPAANFAILLKTQSEFEQLKSHLSQDILADKIDDYLVLATSKESGTPGKAGGLR